MTGARLPLAARRSPLGALDSSQALKGALGATVLSPCLAVLDQLSKEQLLPFLPPGVRIQSPLERCYGGANVVRAPLADPTCTIRPRVSHQQTRLLGGSDRLLTFAFE